MCATRQDAVALFAFFSLSEKTQLPRECPDETGFLMRDRALMEWLTSTVAQIWMQCFCEPTNQ
jgi:hypothetical protein